jgi:hypothetical protein
MKTIYRLMDDNGDITILACCCNALLTLTLNFVFNETVLTLVLITKTWDIKVKRIAKCFGSLGH